MKEKKQATKEKIKDIDVKKIEEECENQKEKTEEYICERGWNDYIDRCVDIIYFNFKNFGWTYGSCFLGIGNKPITRDEIENNVISLIGESMKEKCQVESGRIAVDIVDDELWIALSL